MRDGTISDTGQGYRFQHVVSTTETKPRLNVSRHATYWLSKHLSWRSTLAFLNHEVESAMSFSYQVHVSGVSEEGEVFEVGEGTVKANSAREAEAKAVDELWDRRLDIAGCQPRVRARRI